MKKVLSTVLCLLLLFGTAQTAAAAAEPTNSGKLKLLSYNVSGIPVVGTFQGTAFSYGNKKSGAIGSLLNALDCDIIGVQEDFNYHRGLAGAMTAYPYQTTTSGGLPTGDGLNLFARRPFYNAARVDWNTSYGVVSGSADRLAQKGFIYAAAEIAPGVYVDVYVLHADAGVDFKSARARADNYRQLAAHINARAQDRAVIALGDYNFKYERCLEDDLYDNLIVPAGLKDMWVELHNGGDYTYGGGTDWAPTLGDALDRILFKSGGGVEFTAQAFDFLKLTDSRGKTHTDHMAMTGTLAYTLHNPPANTGELKAEEPAEPQPLKQVWTQVKGVFQALVLVFTHLHELFYLFDQLLIEVLHFKSGLFFS